MNIYDSVGVLKGVGPKTLEKLNKCCIFTILDLLLYFPRDYKSVSIYKNSQCKSDKVILNCKVKSIERDIRTKTGKIITTVIFENEDGRFIGKWFNQPYMKRKFIIGCNYRIIGKIQEFNGNISILNPVQIKDKDSKNSNGKILPVYPLKNGITNNLLVKLISYVLSHIRIKENLPQWIIDKYKLCSLDSALRRIHNPENLNNLNQSRRRLKFQELFTYSLKILMIKEYYNRTKTGIAFKISKELVKLKKELPYELTNAQSKVIREILIDEKRQIPMNRLVQGDVGSGKTIVAFIAIFNVIKNGYQAVLMAPTEILAKQHYTESEKLLKKFNIKIGILSGSTSKKHKEIIKNDIKTGKIDFIIGTHALIEDDVEFKNLGIIVTDEQHRFGVMQRNKLISKGKNADILVMTATPIPRTLTLYLYGDLDVSTINELPPGRKKIETFYINKNSKNKAYEFALKEIKNGRQVYVVCPLVDKNEDGSLSSVEDVYMKLKDTYFRNIPMDILHGKMPTQTKQEVMDRFKKGYTKVIVSTTVIEVGINVPNASLIIVENAERFGLAQLHQLRGRVGRGKYRSKCILVADIKNDVIKKRMEIMKKSNDGFFIAEQDLKIRGGGEIFGFKQHGESELVISDFISDINIFKIANAEARKLIKSNIEEDMRIKREIINGIEKTSKFICFN
ncbi:ATP-dependent DNA helicase RecG [Clostridium sp. cel8]|uniref:ATP-dependent DNA helicase RecG n=1 Tax=Clostridium sp. cel8 TaxID=2663123 RepID=UPI0015F5C77C|nr:ATP-dependent DNA helicase RecG [Clostridium sp. cel8]